MGKTDITKMAMALMLIKRADEALKKVDGETCLLNKAGKNCLKEKRKRKRNEL